MKKGTANDSLIHFRFHLFIYLFKREESIERQNSTPIRRDMEYVALKNRSCTVQAVIEQQKRNKFQLLIYLCNAPMDLTTD